MKILIKFILGVGCGSLLDRACSYYRWLSILITRMHLSLNSPYHGTFTIAVKSLIIVTLVTDKLHCPVSC